jgi:hypothetical protein
MKSKTVLAIVAAAVFTLAGSSQAASISLNPSGDSYIRNGGSANSSFDTHELLVGRVVANNWLRSLMAFDLSSVPDTATINSVTLDLYIDTLDVSSSSGFVGADGIRVYELTSDANFSDGVTYNERDDAANIDWTTAGGDFSTTVLSQIASPTDPDAVSPGDNVNFVTSVDFVNSLAANLVDNGLQLIIRTPSIESSFDARKIYRFGSGDNTLLSRVPVLTIDYTSPMTVPEPNTLVLATLGLLGMGLLGRRRRKRT